MARVLRTPDSCFERLPDYPFEPNYFMLNDGRLGELRLHYLDEGPKDGPVVLLMHGEPSWSFLYRKMIPPLVNAGFRVLAPDLIGFGKSDKPTRKSDYTYQRHVDWMMHWLIGMNVENVTLFCQDWGGLIGLRLVAKQPEWFDQLIISNTALPDGIIPMAKEFSAWVLYSKFSPRFPIGGVLQKGTARTISKDVEHAYDAPFPNNRYKAGARIFPRLVPTSEKDIGARDNQQAWRVLEQFEKPVMTLFGDSDPVTGNWAEVFQSRIPGARGQPHRIIEAGGHFIQEDAGPELAEALIDFVRMTRAGRAAS